MLSDKSRTVVVSSLGWVDRESLWVFRVAEASWARIPLGKAKYLTLHAGTGDFFSVTHHSESDHVEITVHNFSEPGEVVARALLNAEGSRLAGDLTAWSNVQKNYVTYYAGGLWSDSCLVRVDVREGRVELQQFAWFDDSYDKGYQGIMGILEVPGEDLLIVSVQRDSHPVIYNPITRSKIGTLTLAGRGGNPKPFFRRHANELWADDYDSLVKIEPRTWRVLESRLLQPDAGGTRQFIGEFSFDADETVCVVARPFSRDVIGLSPATLASEFRCEMDGQPLVAVSLPDRSVVARDWKSGALLRGDFRRASAVSSRLSLA